MYRSIPVTAMTVNIGTLSSSSTRSTRYLTGLFRRDVGRLARKVARLEIGRKIAE